MSKVNKRAVLGGIGLGAVNGFFGGGGGMVAVPLLGYLGYPQKKAHATAILLIAPVCAISAIVYLVNGFVDLHVLIPSAIGSVAGGLTGAQLLEKLPELPVRILFVAVMLAAGIRTVIG